MPDDEFEFLTKNLGAEIANRQIGANAAHIYLGALEEAKAAGQTDPTAVANVVLFSFFMSLMSTLQSKQEDDE